MSVRKIAVYTVVMVLTFCGGFIVTRRARSQDQPHKAFTAFQVEKRYVGSSIERYREDKIYAVRTDGSWMWMAHRPGPDGRLYDMGEIYDLSRRLITTVDGLTQSVQTDKLSDESVASYKVIDRTCQSATERALIVGRDVFKVPTPRDASQTDAVDWRAPDLDCFSLQAEHTKWGFSAKVLARTTTETVFVVVGDPSPSLFLIPSSYVERSPAQAAEEYQRRFGEAAFPKEVLQRAEQAYAKNHKVE
jgi:hypothetical protein